MSPILVNRAPPIVRARSRATVSWSFVIRRGNDRDHPVPLRKRVRYGAIYVDVEGSAHERKVRVTSTLSQKLDR